MRAAAFPFIIVVTMALLLGTYRYGVRSTWIGALLNGRRKAPGLSNGDVPNNPAIRPTPSG